MDTSDVSAIFWPPGFSTAYLQAQEEVYVCGVSSVTNVKGPRSALQLWGVKGGVTIAECSCYERVWLTAPVHVTHH